MSLTPAIVILGASALKLAERIRAALGAAEIHGLAVPGGETDTSFTEALPHITALYGEGRPIIGICAAGILIRAIGPVLQGGESPVIAVAKDGSSVVPLMGGHHGANDLARRIAGEIGGHAAITTASDAKLVLALDLPPPGWRIKDAAAAKRVMEDITVHDADTLRFVLGDDPVEAIGGYVRAKMTLSQRRPLGSKVWANEIIHGAEHMQDILSQRVKPWFDARVRVIEGWIARGLLAPIDPHALMYLIWATTQHYADFDAQIRALSGKRAFTKKAFDEKTEQVVQLVIRACGAVSPNAKP